LGSRFITRVGFHEQADSPRAFDHKLYGLTGGINAQHDFAAQSRESISFNKSMLREFLMQR